ncbi:lanthionine synthetase-like protein [Streptomyces sp. 846.5]|nr:class III lanthionine synthetase LanKC [Streptomyces sp. 846.5]TDU03353.1 lanthionine synthetase-like protein [Streptomyces sp. 846.5]
MADPREALIYGAADPLYFETPGRLADDATRYPLAGGEVPAGWRRSVKGLWTNLIPDGAPLADQGWKIHVSATPRTAGVTLDRAAAVCLARGVPFKFLRSRQALLLTGSKNMPRGGSGKFVTVYPADDAQLEEVLGELVAALDGLPGPYILSDLRIGRGPVHVRYGAFVDRRCPDEDGLPGPALRDPSGELVPDVREPVFRLPGWVTLPPVLEPHAAARREARDDSFPYLVREALHFSNAGGIYRAEHRDTGQQVVLREARPFSGLDGARVDAVERLHNEYRALMTLQGLDCVPRLHGLRTAWEHHFLIKEYIEGPTLLEAVIGRYPLPGRDSSGAAFRAYACWVATVTGNLAAALDALHDRGVCFRDVHPRNVIVRPDDSVVLVDFEYAADLDARDLPRVGAAGFTAPAGASGAEADQYGLWATWLSMLMMLTEMIDLDPGKAALLETAARERFRLSDTEGPRRPAINGTAINGAATAGAVTRQAEDLFDRLPFDWAAVRDELVAGIHACATPDRADRLFPAHWSVFASGGHTLAHGAAGVLLALHRAGGTVPEQYVDWLVDSARRARAERGYGLYDGLHGAAAVLEELGRREEALEVLARARAAGDPIRVGLLGGQAGVALNLCHFAQRTGDATLLDEAVRTAERLDTLLREGVQDGLRLPSTAGFLDGFSGSALLQLRLHRITGEQRYLAAARAALAWDLGHCVTMPDGTVQAKYGHRHLAYLKTGSGGIALVAREYLTHAEDPVLSLLVASVRPVCASEFVREPGLFGGRAGLVAILGLLGEPGQDQELLRSIRRFSWHAVRREGGLFFPGAGLTRLSADLASGSAGILLALHTVFEGKGSLDALLPVGVG